MTLALGLSAMAGIVALSTAGHAGGATALQNIAITAVGAPLAAATLYEIRLMAPGRRR
ncbi:hypothetical protein ACFVZD_45550 [Streptomyces sp. NPDC058287]|uniref:hypothetical protein n=1 Tax=unclassified Streptomyces TaxID=2593676 RepID=UPI0036EF135A